jgi:hypothetical protein
MKVEKLSLKGIKNVLSRSELKKIMAGGSYSPLCCLCEKTYPPPKPPDFVYEISPMGENCYYYCIGLGFTLGEAYPQGDCGL